MAETFILKDIKYFLSWQNIVEKCNFLAGASYELISYPRMIIIFIYCAISWSY